MKGRNHMDFRISYFSVYIMCFKMSVSLQLKWMETGDD